MEDDRRIVCPVCGSIAYTDIYMITLTGKVVGCTDCIQVVDGDVYEATEEALAYDRYIDQQIDLRREDECGLI